MEHAEESVYMAGLWLSLKCGNSVSVCFGTRPCDSVPPYLRLFSMKETMYTWINKENIIKAAGLLHMTRPTLSQQLIRLDVKTAAICSLILNAANMVPNGVGVALGFFVGNPLDELRFVPLSPPLETAMVLVWKED